MKYLLPFVIFFCMFSTTLKAQSFVAAYAASFSPTKIHFGKINLTIADIEGSPYLDPEYKVGTVLTTDDVLLKDIPLRYNCFDDVLEYRKDNVAYNLKPEDKIKRAEFGGQVFVYKDYEADKGIHKSFFEIFSEGKATLCARFSVKFYKAEDLRGFADPKPARFDDLSEIYYIFVNNSPAQKVLSYNKLIKILADKKSEVDSFINKQKLSVKKGEDLKKIVTFYNSL
jgi:hypothetical protein